MNSLNFLKTNKQNFYYFLYLGLFLFSISILEKVSFDQVLFKKELVKSIQWINTTDAKSLREWCIEMYGNKYSDIIQQAFETIL